MNTNLIPISGFFIGLNGLVALALSYIAATERARARIWHGESPADIENQPDPLAAPSDWAATVERLTQKYATAPAEKGLLQRKVRAHSNFAEYVPQGLLFLIALELMRTSEQLLWLLGSGLTIARLAHAYGVISTYGPSVGRAVGFFTTWLVYIVGSLTCLYASVVSFL
ncbi:MAPEG family protein [Acaryochloris sp. IP29b_bin.148]|uniref:MAPEG family protein n=1 Tax=Acaryochloris sp. IP29b_bin.148 TaxID=2969218 RepID=UPI002611ACEE|nr:MAPEG family protein [Acaryochloris sp. IP29b_bin.148]